MENHFKKKNRRAKGGIEDGKAVDSDSILVGGGVEGGFGGMLALTKRKKKGKEGKKELENLRKGPKVQERGPEIHKKRPKVDNRILTKIVVVNSGASILQ
jgi:hypothetical protein